MNKPFLLLLSFIFSLDGMVNFNDANREYWAALVKGDKDEVAKALQKGAEVDAKTLHQVPFLFYVPTLAIAKLLVEKGVHIKITDSEGNNFIHTLMTLPCSINLLKWSLKYLDINARNKKGQTAAHILVNSASLHILEEIKQKCKFLKKSKINLNIRDKKGESASEVALILKQNSSLVNQQKKYEWLRENLKSY
jgi:ankyrin repeat protein